MIKEVPYNQYIAEVNKQLTSGGLFLTSKGDKVNTMVIGWGGITFFWGKPIFIVPVRLSRYTHQQIEKSNEFTVSVPMGDSLKEALRFCGSRSGRDYDKFKECNLTALPGQKVSTPIIKECSLHYECKVVYKQDMIPENLATELNQKWYPDYHTMYFGEIVACYLTGEI
ncbi:Flavin reductase like domain-containing protein [Caldanaerobius fijiensis DSM 17918]|uniref:Flavin reductase like domain-containing protein n=1 Tax=Caldanaerobius fijiensis DSM 17918 TaxID=1121256 RepID=A0A1M5FN81_9THEO|nr:flavin reductase family protein [Caldanaerobius fijiensis]SHF92884.1 Flavin reductase like domain-containing protein [Caldanaerobius fijiensis DSM 17918]